MGLDERTREDLERWLRKASVYLGTFVAGVFLASAYTYSLHSATDWKIDHLEDRLRGETIRFAELEGEFITMRARVEGQPDREVFDELQQELAGATTRQGKLEAKLDRADRKIRDLEGSRGSWKAKYAKLEKSRDDLALELVVANTSLIAAEEVAMKGEGTLDSSPSPTGSSTAGEYGDDRGPRLANAIGAKPGDGQHFWEASGGSRPQSSRSVALEGTQAGAE